MFRMKHMFRYHCSIDIRCVHTRSSTNTLTTQLYMELPPTSFPTDPFARLRFRYLIFYCPFVTDASQGSLKVVNALIFRRCVLSYVFRYTEYWRYCDSIDIFIFMFHYILLLVLIFSDWYFRSISLRYFLLNTKNEYTARWSLTIYYLLRYDIDILKLQNIRFFLICIFINIIYAILSTSRV